MHRLIAALRAEKPAQIPQVGLRLANKLTGQRTTPQFWKEYMRFTSQPDTFDRLSPHSKCLLTCVACRIDRDVARISHAEQLVKRIFKDVISEKHLCLLNLELINMLLVACYTLKVEIKTQQMQYILDRVHHLVQQNNYFNVEFIVSVMHSFGAVARIYPKMREQMADSQVVRHIIGSFDTLSPNLNARELSLVLYAFDKLKAFDDVVAKNIVQCITQRRSEMEGQTLATILFACSTYPGTYQVLNILRENVHKAATHVTGREACNIFSAYLKANIWDDSLFSLLEPALQKMNAQELCNVVNLLLHKNIKLTNTFKHAYAEHINAKLGGLKLSLLDALTLTQSISCWNITNRIKKQNLDRILTVTINADKDSLSSKHVYLLHYTALIGCRQTASSAMRRISAQLDEETLNNKEMVVLYNAVRNCGAGNEVVKKVEHILKRRLTQDRTFSDIDMHTLAHWGDAAMLTLIAKKKVSCAWYPDYNNIKLLKAILKGIQNDDILELARETIEIILMALSETQHIHTQTAQNARQTRDSVHSNANTKMPCDCRTVVVACEILPFMQGKMDVITIFNKTLDRLSSGYGFKDIQVKLLIALLSVARKLNARSNHITIIAYEVTRQLDDVEHLEFLEYINAVYRLEIELEDHSKIIKRAKRTATTTLDDRVKEATILALASMCFSKTLPIDSLDTVISSALESQKTHTYMLEKAVMLYLQANGTLTDRMYHDINQMLKRPPQGKYPAASFTRETTTCHTAATVVERRVMAEDQNQIQTSVYATLQKIVEGNTEQNVIRAEVPIVFDYIADVLVTRPK